MLESIWYQTLEQLHDSLPHAKTMWLDYVVFKEESGDTLILECDSAMTKANVEKGCLAEASNLMDELSGRKITIELRIATDESSDSGEDADDRTGGGADDGTGNKAERLTHVDPFREIHIYRCASLYPHSAASSRCAR